MSSERPNSVFPYDIFTVILRHFLSHPDNVEDLITLGHVCSAFAHMRRPHLFHQIELTGDPKRQTKLVELVKINPTMSNYIQRVVFRRISPPPLPPPELGVSLTAMMSTPASSAEYLKLPNISELVILGDNLVSYDMAKIPRFSYRRLLDPLMAKKCLVHLCLEGISHLPIVLILSQPKLLHLELRDCMIALWHHHPPSPEMQAKGFNLKRCIVSGCGVDPNLPVALLYCRRLEELELQQTVRGPSANPVSLPTMYLPPPAFRNVKNLRVSTMTEWKWILGMVNGAGVNVFPSLGTITVSDPDANSRSRGYSDKVSVRYVQGSKSLDMAGFGDLSFFIVSLQRLIVDPSFMIQSIYVYHEGLRYSYNQFDSLCGALTAITKVNVLSSIVINISIMVPDSTLFHAGLPFSLAEGLRRLDAILMGDRGDFPVLDYVEICLWTPLRRESTSHRGPEAGCLGHTRNEYSHFLEEPLKRLMLASNEVDVCCAVYAL